MPNAAVAAASPRGESRAAVIRGDSWAALTPAPPPLRVVALEASTLLVRRRELVKAIGELDAIAVQLEAPRRARLARIEARQRRLGSGIAVHESQRLAAEPRADERTHEQLEPHVAVGARAREAERLRRLRQLGVGGGERIKRELAGEDVPVADALAGALCAHPAEQLAHQRFHLLH